MSEWIACATRLPPDDEIVMTMITDARGWRRNEQRLKRRGKLWWTPDGAMYVYYTPTHWKPV